MNELNIDFEKYKKYIFPSVFFLLGIFLLFYILIPQTMSIFDLQAKIIEKQEVLNDASEVLDVVESFSDEKLEEKLILAETAYPHVGNIMDIYLSIESAAIKSSSSITGFSMRVGSVYYKNEEKEEKELIESILLTVDIMSDSKRNYPIFVQEMYKILPLSIVERVTMKDDEARFEIKTFKKQYDIPALSSIKQIKPVILGQEKLLKQMEDWKPQNQSFGESSSESSLSASVASESAKTQ